MKARYMIVILWALWILLATSNYNFQALLFAQDIKFNILLFPDFSDLFIMSDIHLDSKTYVFQKIGHAISFGVFFLLLSRNIADSRKAIIICSLFALSTEILQLFFERSGRLSDVLIDISGIYLAYRLKNYIQKQGGLEAVLRIKQRIDAP